MLTVNDIVLKCEVTERTVRKWIAEEGMPHEQKKNRRIVVDPDKFEKWYQENKAIVKTRE